MRRRIRSAAFPVHRHSLPQLLVDGVLVALAYFLAFRLRFDGRPRRRQRPLRRPAHAHDLVGRPGDARRAGRVRRCTSGCGRSSASATTRPWSRAWSSRRCVIVGAIALLHPVTTTPHVSLKHFTAALAVEPVTLPASVIALFFLLALALLVGARFLVHLVVEGRVRSFRVAKGARDVLIVGGGEGGRLVVRELVRNPQLRLRPVGFVDDDPRKQGIKDEYGLQGARHDRVRGSRAGPRRGRARRGRDRDPVRPGDAARPGGHGVPRRAGSRCGPPRPCSSCSRTAPGS